VRADALLAVNTLGASKVYVLDDGTLSGAGLAAGMKNMLGALGATVAGSSSWDPSAPSYQALATTIQQSGAQAVFLGGSLTSNGAKLVRDLRSVLGNSAAFIAPDTFEPAASLATAAGLAANGVYLAAGGVPTSALASPGQTFAAKFLALYHTVWIRPRHVRQRRPSSCSARSRARPARTRRSARSSSPPVSHTGSSGTSCSTATATSRRIRSPCP
jgi:ABC-type branched-subunit amino acid transport system substrate-binding protein